MTLGFKGCENGSTFGLDDSAKGDFVSTSVTFSREQGHRFSYGLGNFAGFGGQRKDAQFGPAGDFALPALPGFEGTHRRLISRGHEWLTILSRQLPRAEFASLILAFQQIGHDPLWS